MKLAIIIYSNDAETVWNAFRLGNFSLQQSDTVRTFLLAKGVECEALDNTTFRVDDEMQSFIDQGGEILACGTCLKIRRSEGSERCPLSTMADLYQMIKESDRVVTF